MTPIYLYTGTSKAGVAYSSAEAPTNAGTYQVKVTIPATGLYTKYETTLDFTIAQKELTISLTIPNKPYDGLLVASYHIAALNGRLDKDKESIHLDGEKGKLEFESAAVGKNIPVKVIENFVVVGDAAVLSNYILKQPTGLKGEITNVFNPIGYYSVAKDNIFGWHDNNVVISAKEGYLISTGNEDSSSWGTELTATAEGENKEFTFYVREKATKLISQKATVHYNLDKTAPTLTAAYADTELTWDAFQEDVTFTNYFNHELTLNLNPADSLSGIQRVEYVKKNAKLTLDQ